MLEDYASLCEEYSNHQISHQQQQVIDFSPFEEDPSEINQHVCKQVELSVCVVLCVLKLKASASLFVNNLDV